MPSFKEQLTSEQIDKVIEHIRSLCTDTAWPRGDMNLPRPLYTDKAFPENETVISNTVSANKEGFFGSNIIYERRYGARNNLEFTVPFNFSQNAATNTWFGGVGDIAIQYKRVAYYNQRSGTLLSGATEVALPTGNKRLGL